MSGSSRLSLNLTPIGPSLAMTSVNPRLVAKRTDLPAENILADCWTIQVGLLTHVQIRCLLQGSFAELASFWHAQDLSVNRQQQRKKRGLFAGKDQNKPPAKRRNGVEIGAIKALVIQTHYFNGAVDLMASGPKNSSSSSHACCSPTGQILDGPTCGQTPRRALFSTRRLLLPIP